MFTVTNASGVPTSIAVCGTDECVPVVHLGTISDGTSITCPEPICLRAYAVSDDCTEGCIIPSYSLGQPLSNGFDLLQLPQQTTFLISGGRLMIDGQAQ